MSTQKNRPHLSDGRSANGTEVVKGESNDNSNQAVSFPRLHKFLSIKSSPPPTLNGRRSATQVNSVNETTHSRNSSLYCKIKTSARKNWIGFLETSQEKCANLIKSTSSSFWIVCLVLCAFTSLFILIQFYLNYVQLATTTTKTTTMLNKTADSTAGKSANSIRADPNLLVYPLNLVNSTMATRARVVLGRQRRRRSVAWMHTDHNQGDIYTQVRLLPVTARQAQQVRALDFSSSFQGAISQPVTAASNKRAGFVGQPSNLAETRWTPIVKQSSPAESREKLVSNTMRKPSPIGVPAKQQPINSHKSLVTTTITTTTSSTSTTTANLNNEQRPRAIRPVAATAAHPRSNTPANSPRDLAAKPSGQRSKPHQPKNARRAPPSTSGLRQSASLASYHWRRPRFQHSADQMYPMQSKVYKRVLLCDKTLVSLDYLRRFPAKDPTIYSNHVSGPANSAPMSHYASTISNELADEFGGDNFIDLDGNFASSASEPMADLHRSNETITRPLERRSSAAVAESISYPSSSYLLPDDEPLVKCDMWDLEKGLKNRKPPLHLLQQAVRADFDTVRDAINRCRQLSERILPPEDEYRGDGLEIMSTEDLMSLFSMKRGLLPGTKWCGLGDQADSYNDLGPKHRIDICCRAHDHCPIRSKPFRNDYGILNIGLYTKSHCDCDADFYRCLREARSRTADMLGNLYFNVMKLQCMREERMKVCREVKPIALGFERCIRYEDSNLKRVFKFTSPPVAY